MFIDISGAHVEFLRGFGKGPLPAIGTAVAERPNGWYGRVFEVHRVDKESNGKELVAKQQSVKTTTASTVVPRGFSGRAL